MIHRSEMGIQLEFDHFTVVAEHFIAVQRFVRSQLRELDGFAIIGAAQDDQLFRRSHQISRQIHQTLLANFRCSQRRTVVRINLQDPAIQHEEIPELSFISKV